MPVKSWLLRSAAIALVSVGFIAAAQFASTACVECRNRCVSARESCKQNACTSAGGRNQGGYCVDVKNHTAYVNGLTACSNQEGVCKNQCQSTSCVN